MNISVLIKRIANTLVSAIHPPARIKIILEQTYPYWHTKSGKKTAFTQSVIYGNKIHCMRTYDMAYWMAQAEKFRARPTHVNLVYYADQCTSRSRTVCTFGHFHIQTASFDRDPSNILVEGRPVPTEVIARNEGITTDDLLEYHTWLGDREFLILHFTPFRYNALKQECL